jgi:hypothetical protein
LEVRDGSGSAQCICFEAAEGLITVRGYCAVSGRMKSSPVCIVEWRASNRQAIVWGSKGLAGAELEGHGLRLERPSGGSDDVDDGVAWGVWLSDEGEALAETLEPTW